MGFVNTGLNRTEMLVSRIGFPSLTD